MNIALFTETYFPHVNGIVTHVKILKEGLEKLGHNVLIVTADANTKRHYVSNGILHCPARPFKKIYNYDLAQPLSRTRLKLLGEFKPDIIHIHNEFGIGMSGMLIAKVLRVPMVYTLHTMYDEYLFYVAPRNLISVTRKITHQYTKFLANCASALTGPSKKCEEYFKLCGVHKMVSLIPNSVELDNFAPEKISEEAKQAFREKYNIPEDRLLVCFVGRIGPEKSVDVLLDFFAQTMKYEDGVTLIIIGDGPVREDLVAQAEKLGISDMVVFTGKVPHPELPPYYAACSAYITASLTEMHSISMLEGMASGLPVLIRYDPLNADQTRDGENSYVYQTPEEMADKLKYLKSLSPNDMSLLKHTVIESVKQSGAEDLGNYMLTVYRDIYMKNEKLRARFEKRHGENNSDNIQR